MSNPNIKNYGFGNRSKEKDDEIRAMGREVRQANIGKPRLWTKEKCIDELDDILQCFKRILRESEKLNKDNLGKLKQESIRDLTSMMNRILDFMKYLYPQTQTNVNVNVDMTADIIIERLKNYKRNQVATNIVDIVPSEVIQKE